MTPEEQLQPLCDYLRDQLKEELKIQGHVATGKLMDSIKVAARQTATGYIIEGKGEGYGKYVDSGRRAGIKRVPIDALVGWIRAKGIPLNGKKEISVAFAIQAAIFKNGIPSNKAKDKTAFITNMLGNNKDEITQEIMKAVTNFYTIEIHNIVWNTKQILEKQ